MGMLKKATSGGRFAVHVLEVLRAPKCGLAG